MMTSNFSVALMINVLGDCSGVKLVINPPNATMLHLGKLRFYKKGRGEKNLIVSSSSFGNHRLSPVKFIFLDALHKKLESFLWFSYCAYLTVKTSRSKAVGIRNTVQKIEFRDLIFYHHPRTFHHIIPIPNQIPICTREIRKPILNHLCELSYPRP